MFSKVLKYNPLKMDTTDMERIRDTWISLQLLKLSQGLSILDAGAGECQYKKYCQHLVYTSQDFCQYDGTGNGSALQTGKFDTASIDIVCDITSIPIPDKTYDIILCTEVLKHTPDPQLVIKELSRLLKPGGILILTAPFCSPTHFAPYHFADGFSRYWYYHHLPKNQLQINSIEPIGNYFS